MLARVLDRRDDARAGIGATALAAFALLLVLADDATHLHLVPGASGTVAYTVVAALMAIAAIGPWLVRGRRGRLVHVACGQGLVAFGRLTIAASEVHSVHVARAARGASVAIARAGGGTVFAALEREEDAVAIARALGHAGDLPLPRGAPLLAGLQGVFSIATLAFAALYWSGATGALSFGDKEDGVLGVVFAVLSLVLVLTRRRATLAGHRLAFRSREWDAHLALHARSDADVAADDAASRADAAAAPSAPSPLVRGDESPAEWLARIDALAAATGAAYRAGALDRDALWAALLDPSATADVRIAAARILERRFGERRAELVRVAEDPDVRVRIEAVLGDAEDEDLAPQRLARLGPLFRAR